MFREMLDNETKHRIIQELVPGKEITIAHLIANPDEDLYIKLGLNPKIDYSKSAIGLMTITPAETAVIAADVAMKAAGVTLGFVDRFAGACRWCGGGGGYPERNRFAMQHPQGNDSLDLDRLQPVFLGKLFKERQRFFNALGLHAIRDTHPAVRAEIRTVYKQ